jgi:hypothetical protein
MERGGKSPVGDWNFCGLPILGSKGSASYAKRMAYERVYTIRDIHDGIRSGTADFNGLPHYFSSLSNEQADDISSLFHLCPVDDALLAMELEQWSIYRAWEAKFHAGRESLETHPGNGGIDPRYDALNRDLDQRIAALEPLPTLFEATFRSLPDQESLASGILREMEVAWKAVAAA